MDEITPAGPRACCKREGAFRPVWRQALRVLAPGEHLSLAASQEEVGPIRSELLRQGGQCLLNAGTDLVGWRVDEVQRKLGDEMLQSGAPAQSQSSGPQLEPEMDQKDDEDDRDDIKQEAVVAR